MGFYTGFTIGDYANEWYDNQMSFATANIVTVTAGSTTIDINAYLEQAGEISGTVTSADKPGGVAGVDVYVYDLAHTSYGSATTDSDGKYEVGKLFAGSYRVEFAPGGDYLDEWYDNQTSFASANTVTVTEGTATTDINASLEKNIAISGTVTSVPSPAGWRALMSTPTTLITTCPEAPPPLRAAPTRFSTFPPATTWWSSPRSKLHKRVVQQ